MATTSLRGKTALVTGAAKRIGRQLALSLAEEGVNIVIHYRNSAQEAEEVGAALMETGIKSWAIKADFENAAEYQTLVGRALEAAGSLDILINSASLFRPSTLQDVEFEGLMQHLQVNAWTPFVLSRDFARLVGRGKIINLLDTRISGYDWAHVAYILSKHALSVLTRMMAVAFAPQITVNAIAPGLILPPPGRDESYLQQLAETVPLKRHGGPSDIAEAALCLIKSDFITGQVVNVDGGRHIMEYGDGPNPH